MRKCSLYKFKYISFMLSIILSLNLIITTVAVKADVKVNRVINAIYEDSNNDGKPEQWNYYAKGNNYVSTVSKEVFNHKPNSLILDVTEDTNAVIVHQTIKLKGEELNKKYKFSQWIKTEELKGNGAFVRLQITDISNKGLETIEVTPKLTGNTEWTKLEYTVSIPQEIKGTTVGGFKIENYVSAKTSGKAYFNEPVLELVGNMEEEVPDTIKSLIENGGFEKHRDDGTPDKWNTWKSTGGLLAVIDEKVFKEGKSSVKISNEQVGKNSRGTLNQTIKPITEEMQNQSLKVSQWIKTEGFKGKGFSVRLQYKDKNGGKIEPMGFINVDLKENMDWTEFTYVIDLPKEKIDSIVFEYLYDDCEGSVWIDNAKVDSYVKLKEIDSTPNNVDLKMGESVDLKLNFNPLNATIKEVNFSSKNEDIASVSENGKITAKKNGVTKIMVTQNAENIVREIPVVVGKSNDIIIEPINEIEVAENANVSRKVIATSTEGLELIYNLLTKPNYGTVNLMKNGTFEYYPNKNYSGKDTFTIGVTDIKGNYNTIKIDVNVLPLNKEPIFEDFVINTNENVPIINKGLNGKDPEGKDLTYKIVGLPKNGTFDLKGNSYNFMPNNNFNGYDSVKIKAIDDVGNEKIAEGRIYVSPSLNNIDGLVKKEHPRMLANSDDFTRLRNLIKTDENAKQWFGTLKNKIDKILDKPVVPYNKPDGLRLDTQASKNIVDLAFMYQLTNDEKYAKRAWLELESVSVSYPDWSHEHLLDTGMTAFGVALGYDWLYEYLSVEQRNIIENAIVNKALKIAHKYYLNNSHFFVEDTLNWNFVCNTGFTAAALSIMGDNNSKLATEILQESFKSIQNGLTQYYPQGDSIEGVSYWDYGTRYLVYFLSSVSSAMEGTNPFINAPGIKETPDFPMYMTGKVGSYNYSDNDTSLAAGYLSLWFAKELNRPDLTWYHKYYMENSGVLNVYDLLWYDPELYKGDVPKDLDRAYERQSVITMRKDWTDANSSFVGFKGGLNGAPHGDLDIGSFVYDALGVRWATELGKENYNLPGYWEKEENGRRWTYYRKRAEGHNTLVINPMNKTRGDQKVGVHSKIEEMNLNNPNGAYGIVDMSNAYEQDALKVKRGVKFINRNELLVRDEFLLKEPGEVIWQMHTGTDIEIIEGGKGAILKEGNKRLYVKLLTKGENKFEVMNAEPYIATNTHENAFSNEDFKKLVVKTNGKEGSIDVWMAPYVEGEEKPSNEPTIVPLELWKEWNPSTPNPEPDVEEPGEGNGSEEGTKPGGDNGNPGDEGNNSGGVPDINPDENKPGNEGNEKPSVTPEEGNSNNNEGQLPNTGGKSALTLGVIGILLVVVGGVLFIKPKKINK